MIRDLGKKLKETNMQTEEMKSENSSEHHQLSTDCLHNIPRQILYFVLNWRDLGAGCCPPWSEKLPFYISPSQLTCSGSLFRTLYNCFPRKGSCCLLLLWFPKCRPQMSRVKCKAEEPENLQVLCQYNVVCNISVLTKNVKYSEISK